MHRLPHLLYGLLFRELTPSDRQVLAAISIIFSIVTVFFFMMVFWQQQH